MKLTGILGTGSGKLGSSVFSVSGGQQVVRQYQPVVSNPSTDAQVEQRAKLKLLSQLGSALQSVIAIRKNGLVSARNRFTSVNYRHTYFDQGIANIELADIELTDSNFALSGFSVDRSDSTMHVEMEESQSDAIDQIMYIVLRRTSSETIGVASSTLVENAGSDGLFAAELPKVEGDIVVLAYGIRFADAAAKGRYGVLIVENSSRLAQLITANAVPINSVGLTQTRGLMLPEGVNSGITSGVFTANVSAIAYDSTAGAANSAAGTISGAGRVEVGTAVTLRAVANDGYIFRGWKKTPDSSFLSQVSTYTFVVDNTTTIYAVFSEDLTLRVNVGFTSDSSVNNAALTGAGTYEAGAQVTVSAPTVEGEDFVGWFSAATGGNRLSTSSSYTFTMGNENVSVYAKYQDGVSM